MDEYTRTTLLYDYYGKLLSKRQREVTELYYDDNMSLSEIAEEFGISRQGVHDALNNGKKALEEYEEKLGLVARFEGLGKKMDQLNEKLDRLARESKDEETVDAIRHIIAEMQNA